MIYKKKLLAFCSINGITKKNLSPIVLMKIESDPTSLTISSKSFICLSRASLILEILFLFCSNEILSGEN
tara:strand:+ start:150 stop:359 length:210 start_codon:yes stop_codon:yes gene_type:complete